MTTRRALLALLTCAATTLAPALAQTTPHPAAPATDKASKELFKVEKGPYEVIETDVTLRDEARGKDVELRIRTPKVGASKDKPAPLPLLVFSHGAGGSRDAFPGLQDLLASHGYVTIAPTHADSIAQSLKNGDDKAPKVRELNTPEGRRKLLGNVKLADRVKDCTLIVDKLADISALVEKTGGRAFTIDPNQIAIAGHSAGAFTTQLCAGVKVRGAAVNKLGQGMVSITDDRFKAAVIISGQGTASPSLSESSWDALKVPILVFSGSLDDSPPNMGNETPQTRRHPYEKSRGTAKGGPPAYLMYIEGATHGSYQGKIGAGEKLQKVIGDAAKASPAEQVGNATNAAVLTFLNAHLRKDAKALDTLNSDALARTLPGKVEYQHK